MLRPSIQPGSKIDYTWPDEKVTLLLSSSMPFLARTRGDQVAAGGFGAALHDALCGSVAEAASADLKPATREIHGEVSCNSI